MQESEEISVSKRFCQQIDALTDENLRYFSGVLEALFFAQHTLGTVKPGINREAIILSHQRDTVTE